MGRGKILSFEPGRIKEKYCFETRFVIAGVKFSLIVSCNPKYFIGKQISYLKR